MATILERLLRSDVPPQQGNDSAQGDNELESILEYLRRLLNTRRESAPSCPEYGLPPVNAESASSLYHTALAEMIAGTITRFEPRLRSVRVIARAADSKQNQLLAHFHIQAVRCSNNTVVELRAASKTDGNIPIALVNE